MSTTEQDVQSQLTSTQKVKVTTANKNGFSNSTNSNGDPILEVEIEVSVPSDTNEATDFFGGEQQVLEILQQEVVRRKANLARPILREAESELDWLSVATEAAEGYRPGRRGGFQPKMTEDELEGLSSDEIIARMRAKGMLK